MLHTAKLHTTVFPNLFLRHPYLVFKVFCGTPGQFNRYKDQEKVTIDGTPSTSSRHPGWEPLTHYIRSYLFCYVTTIHKTGFLKDQFFCQIYFEADNNLLRESKKWLLFLKLH